jgi:hypothetical protein
MTHFCVTLAVTVKFAVAEAANAAGPVESKSAVPSTMLPRRYLTGRL